MLGSVRLFATLALVVSVAGCYQSHEVGRDAGPRPDTPGVVRCEDETLPPYAGPPCSDAVHACRALCDREDEPCRSACVDEACNRCIFGTILPCANRLGCEDLWQTFACCIEAVPGCEDLRGLPRTECAMNCPMRFEPYAMCIEGTGTECFLLAASVCGLR